MDWVTLIKIVGDIWIRLWPTLHLELKCFFVIRLLLTSWNGSSPPNTDDQTRDANVPDIAGVAAEGDMLTLQPLRERKKAFLTPADRKMKPGGSVLNLRSRLTVHRTTLFWDG